jgi:thymidylate synthase (FAD)
MPLPDFNYVPTIERLMLGGGRLNKQAQRQDGASQLTEENAARYQRLLLEMYFKQEDLYITALVLGVPKELARVHIGVGRYSVMRASANLLNWLRFLGLRLHEDAQWEIRQYAHAVGDMIADRFPRTWELFEEKPL